MWAKLFLSIRCCKLQVGGWTRPQPMRQHGIRIARVLIIANCMQISLSLQIGVVGENVMQSLMAEWEGKEASGYESSHSAARVYDHERYLKGDLM